MLYHLLRQLKKPVIMLRGVSGKPKYHMMVQFVNQEFKELIGKFDDIQIDDLIRLFHTSFRTSIIYIINSYPKHIDLQTPTLDLIVDGTIKKFKVDFIYLQRKDDLIEHDLLIMFTDIHQDYSILDNLPCAVYKFQVFKNGSDPEVIKKINHWLKNDNEQLLTNELSDGDNIFYANDLALSLTNIPREQYKSHSIMDIISSEDKVKFIKTVFCLLKKEEVITKNFIVNDGLGGYRILECTMTISDKNYPCSIVMVASDLTNTMKTYDKMENYYKHITNHSPVCVCHFNPNYGITYVNTNYVKFRGKPKSELIGSNFLNNVIRESVTSIEKALYNIRNDLHATFDIKVIHNGKTITQTWHVFPSFNDFGMIHEYQAIGSMPDEKSDYISHDEMRERAENLVDVITDLTKYTINTITRDCEHLSTDLRKEIIERVTTNLVDAL